MQLNTGLLLKQYLYTIYNYSKTQIGDKFKQENQIPISRGVLQGSVLSPVIFNIYIDDLIDKLVNENTEQNTFAYADDIMIFQND